MVINPPTIGPATGPMKVADAKTATAIPRSTGPNILEVFGQQGCENKQSCCLLCKQSSNDSQGSRCCETSKEPANEDCVDVLSDLEDWSDQHISYTQAIRV